MKTKVYSVFPACGKTWLCKHQDIFDLKILDSDSSYFAWIWEYPEDDERGMFSPNARKTKERNPNFPENYIDHIKCKIESEKYDYIFVSSHSSVREALDKEGIDFTIVYPENKCIAEWVGRCFIRDKLGESGCGAETLFANWRNWIAECFETGINHEEIVLKAGEHLSDYLIKYNGYSDYVGIVTENVKYNAKQNNVDISVRDSKRFCESGSDHNWVEYTNGKSSVFICQKCYAIKN